MTTGRRGRQPSQDIPEQQSSDRCGILHGGSLWWCAGASGCSNNKLRGRIEFLPVEWHTKFREKAGEGEEVRGHVYVPESCWHSLMQ